MNGQAATEYAGRLQLHPFPARWGPPPADFGQRSRWILTWARREDASRTSRANTQRQIAMFARRYGPGGR